MSTTATAEQRTEFENVSEGVIGVVVLNDDNKPHGTAVKPGETIWLSEREEILTANAPRRDEDNPFAKGWLVPRTRPHEVLNRRPIGSRSVMVDDEQAEDDTSGLPPREDLDQGNDPVAPPKEEKPPVPDEVAAPPLPEGDPERGVRQPGEEVGTPQAIAKASAQERRPAPAKPRGQTVVSTPPGGEREAAKPGTPAAAVVGPQGTRLAPQTGAEES